MRISALLGTVAIAAALAACDSPVAVRPTATTPSADVQPTGPSNVCYGQIVAGIASTWPWAHEPGGDFAPPPGAIALWIELFGPTTGVTSVRDLQVLFCS